MEKIAAIYQNRMRPHSRKIVVGLIIFFVLFTIIGFFAVPPILKSILIRQLSESIHRQVTIREIKVNPYSLSVTIKGLLVKERKSTAAFLACEEIYINLGTLSALRLAPVLKEIHLTKPYVRIIRNQDFSYNFSDLLESPPNKPQTGLPKFALNNIRLTDGNIDFDDHPKQTKHSVRELKIGIPFFSTIPSDVQRYVQPHLSAKINGALYTLDGKSKPFADSHETSFDIQIKDLNLPEYLPYVPLKMNLQVLSAVLDTQGKITFIETKKKEPSLTVSGVVSLKNIALADLRNSRFLTLPLFEAALAPSEPLLKKIHLSKVSLASPQVVIRRDEKGALNTQNLFPDTSRGRPEPQKTESSSPLLFNIDELSITAGQVTFSDLYKDRPFKTVVDSIEAKVDHFSTAKGQKGNYSLTFKTEAKETVKSEGGFSLDPLSSDGKVEVQGVSLNKYSPYYKDKLLFTIEEGRLDLSSNFNFAKSEKDGQFSLSGLSVGLQALRLRKNGENNDFVRIPALSIKDTNLDLGKNSLQVGIVNTDKGEITIKRSRNGDLNLLNLFPKTPAPSEATKASTNQVNSAPPAKPWLITLRQLGLDNYLVRVEDQTTAVPQKFNLQNLKIKGENISTAKNSRGKIASSLVFNEKGSLSAAGTFGLEPFSADIRTEVKGIEFSSFQGYFAKKLKATLTGGAVSTTGRLFLSSTEKEGLKTSYKGEAAISNFSAIDKLTGNDLLDFQNLSFNEIDLGFSPFSLSVKGVSLNDFYAYVRVSPEGKINFQEIMVAETSKDGTPPPSPAKAGASPPEDKSAKNIKIDKVTLQNGKLEFVDTYVKPEFSTILTEIVGRVSGLSSELDTTADVQLYAKQNEYAPLEISGKINPLSKDLFIDLKARIKDLDLSQATPYSGRYAGYTIEKGMLNFEAQYSINNGKLESQNIIHLDQFTFGEKVDSPQATKLPVRLAVALLKDRKGVIKLDLPVTGSLDDPKFSVWKIVVQIIVNLITKAATSPFALLGSIFGGSGEEMSYLEFDYGSPVVSAAGLKKLDSITKALEDRPSLHIDIEGHVDKERDKDSLRRFLFDRKIKVQKQNEMARKGTSVIPINEIKIDPAEYPRYLKMAYRKEKFPKPKNLVGLSKDLPVPEMEKLMLANIEVSESDLRTLASQRAREVKEAILNSKRVDPHRVFIVEPKTLEPEKKTKMKDSRVDFKLK